MTPEVELCGPLRLILLNGEVFVADDRQPGGSVEIGLLSDGWKVHSGPECPVGADERVEVVFSMGGRATDKAWTFDQRGMSDGQPQWKHVVAYRLAPSREPQPDPFDSPSGQTHFDPAEEERARRSDTITGSAPPKPPVQQGFSPDFALIHHHPQPIAPSAEDMIRAAYERALKGGSWQGMLECGRALAKLSELQPITPEKAS